MLLVHLQERLDLLALNFATKRAAEAEAAIVQMDVRLLFDIAISERCCFAQIFPEVVMILQGTCAAAAFAPGLAQGAACECGSEVQHY